MYRPIQPQFKIRVFNGKRVTADTLKSSSITLSDDNYIDIEPCVTYPVEYSEQENLLNTLRFTVDKNADLLLYYFYLGQSVIFHGGYYADNQVGMKHVFSGTVTRIRTVFSDSGRVSFTVECINYGYTKLGKDPNSFVYPDKSSSRKFAKSENLTIEQIVRGVASEAGYDVGEIDLSSEAKAVIFNKTNICYQRNESDWKFLNRLAQDSGCTVWISTEDGSEKLNFASREKSFQKQSDIGFLYPLYNMALLDTSGSDNVIRDYEIQKFSDPAYNRPRILRNVTVDEDISQADAVSRSVVYFDKETGNYKEAMSKIETDKNGESSITFYELDEAKVTYVHQNLPHIADKIRDGGPTSLRWGTPDNPECASYYYRKIKIYDEQIDVFDKALFGISMTATCNQDLGIRSHRTYKVRGILSYRSKGLDTSFHLKGLKHIWDSNGTWTELEFVR